MSAHSIGTNAAMQNDAMIFRLTIAMLAAGCVNEYHPEYHPVSIVTVEQRGAEPDYTALFRDAGDPFAVPDPVPQDVNAHSSGRPSVIIGGDLQIQGNVTINGDVYINAR